MAVWTDTDILAVNDLVSYTDLNTLKGNIEYLHTPNKGTARGTAAYLLAAGNYGIDVDAGVFSLSIITYGGPVLATFRGMLHTGDTLTSARLSIVYLDAVSFVGRNLFNTYDDEIVSTVPRCSSWSKLFFGLPSGSHTFRLIWGVDSSTGGTAFIQGGTAVTFMSVQEL